MHIFRRLIPAMYLNFSIKKQTLFRGNLVKTGRYVSKLINFSFHNYPPDIDKENWHIGQINDTQL